MVNEMKRVAFVFPGQGSQAVGMGKDIYENYELVKDLFNRADRYLDRSLKELMFEGPGEELTQTEYAQPALLLMSVAINAVLRQEKIFPVVTAGHSLGEYSALVAAKALKIEDALPLVNKRGKLMEKAFPKGQGTMAAVLGLNAEEIGEILNRTEETAEIANINCPGQIVISGTKQGIEEASNLLKENGAKRVLPLNVSGPFHSSLMKPASESLAEELSSANLSDAEIPVYANVTATPVQNKNTIEKLLVEQLYSPVRFEETIRAIKEENIDAIVEIGNGKVLTGLIKKIDRRMTVFSVQDSESIGNFIQWYREE